MSKELVIYIAHTADGSVWASKSLEETRKTAERLATQGFSFDGKPKPVQICITQLTVKKDGAVWDEYIDRYFPIKDKPGEFVRAALMPI